MRIENRAIPILLFVTVLVGAGLVPAGTVEAQPLPDRWAAFDGATNPPVCNTAEWWQIYHELHGETGALRTWPDVAEVRRQARSLGRDGSVPVALLDADGRFAVAPTRRSTLRRDRVVFTFPPALFFSERGAVLSRLEVDFADGRGPRTVAVGEAVAVSYASAGPREVSVRAVWPDGTTRHGRFAFAVARQIVPPPDDTWIVTAEIPYLGGLGSGTAYVLLAEGHAAVTNPVVVIEGFDIDNSLNWDEIYTLMNEQDMVETLRDEGFDLVVLNFDDSTDFIQRHAFLTVALLQQIDAVTPPDAETVVVGASMGGLVGRYALAYMEQNGLAHTVRSFIAFDSPQDGANIPLGLQYWVDFFAAQAAEAEILRQALNQPSPRQLLVYHYAASPPGGADDDPLRDILAGELADLGGYPQGPRKVAVANGSGAQMDQGFAAGAQVILYEYTSILVDIIGNVWAVPDGGDQIIFHGLIDQIWPLPDTEATVSVSGTEPYDTAPGGSRPTMAQMGEVEVPFGDLIALHDSHCFVPTISALDVATDDLFHDIAGDPDILALTPFDAIYYPLVNEEHVAITPANVVWLLDEVRGTVTTAGDGALATPGAPGALRVFPNPFNPRTSVAFALEQPQRVAIVVYDLIGRRVAELAQREFAAGRHAVDWDGRDARGRALASGTYVVRVESEGGARSAKLMLVR